MRLTLTLSGGITLEASDVFLTRALGEPVHWRFNVRLHPGSRGEDELALENRVQQAIRGGPCHVTARWSGDGPSIDIGVDATIISASRPWGERWTAGAAAGLDPQSLEIRANATAVGKQPDGFTPRRRVHKVQNLKDLVRRFDHVARPIGALQSDLDRVTFPDGAHCSIVQDDLSDWDFLHHVLDQSTWLRKPADTPWLPLTLVGGTDKGADTEGRWIITPGQLEAYQQWGAIAERTLHYDDSTSVDGAGEIHFGSAHQARRVPDYPGGEFPSVVERRSHRTATEARWTAWRGMDLPRFAEDGAMIHRIEDRLYADDQRLGWDTQTYALPPQARLYAPRRPRPRRSWVGIGRVKQTSPEGPWITVELPGFEPGENLVDARLATPYSGKDGRRGLHWVPENGTEIVLAWSGRFDESIFVAGNVRSQAAEFPSPSTYLEDEHKAQYADIHVVKIGKTTIDSGLDVGVRQQTDIKSQRRLQVKADGADLRMQRSIVYTGRDG